MKMMKKLFAIALVAAIVLSLGVTAMAQDVGGTQAASGKGQITISMILFLHISQRTVQETLLPPQLLAAGII